MKSWLEKRSLKVRLTLWYTIVATAILGALTPVVYRLIEHRLHLELERQLQIDWNLVVAHLEEEPGGRIRWRPQSPGTPDSPAYAATAFDVWANQELLLQHWPTPPVSREAPHITGEGDQLSTVQLVHGKAARAVARATRIGGHECIIRVLRDESDVHRTLQQILIAFALGVPVAGLLAAFGGYIMAGRALAPVSAIAEQARQITAESLGQRLSYPNSQDELGTVVTVFNQTLDRLQNSFEALRRFTADASHELRTPLTALRAVGEVALRDRADPERLRETIGSMLEEAERLQKLADSLLMLTRIENERWPVRAEKLVLDEIASAVHESLSVLAGEKEQRFQFVPDAGAVAWADAVLTRQALTNMADNAIRYSPAGSTIEVRCFRRDSQAGIEVVDQGPGIIPEYRDRVFERFFRIDKARSRDDGGTGLGLSIAKLSIERQGGKIELESEPGKGSCFRIILPAAQGS